MITIYGKIAIQPESKFRKRETLLRNKIVTKIEEKYDFEFEDENLNFQVFENLRSLIEYINSKIGKN